MRPIARSFAALALTACALTATFTAAALAQSAKQQAPAGKQIALSEKLIEALLAAQKDIDSFNAKPSSPSSSIAQVNANIVAQLNALVKKHGFADYADYNIALDNIGLVMAGIDAKTRTYVGPAVVTRQKIAAIQADKAMSPEDKKEALTELEASTRASLPAVENKGNIDLVIKHYDKLAAIMQDE